MTGEEILDGPRIVTQTDMEAPEVGPFAGGEVCLFTTRSPSSDVVSEDAAALIPLGDHGGVLAVADGAGGMPAGEEAARLALTALVECLSSWEPEERPLRAAILDGFEAANAAVKGMGTGSGTTLAVAATEDGVLRTFHVGDSMILLTGQRGRLKLQTTPHSPTGYGMEAGLLDEKEAVHHDDRNLVLNLVGSSDMTIEIGPQVPLAARDTLLLASDGLADNLYLGEIVDQTRKGPLAEACGTLVQACHARMKGEEDAGRPCHPDDLTILLFRINANSSQRLQVEDGEPEAED